MNLKHFYNIVDETTGEMIYSGWAYSQESLLEGDFRKADYAIQLHEGRLKAQEELDALNEDHDCHLTKYGEDGCNHPSHNKYMGIDAANHVEPFEERVAMNELIIKKINV